jgi:hypothetical protein
MAKNPIPMIQTLPGHLPDTSTSSPIVLSFPIKFFRQASNACSTLQTKYAALSYALKTLLPIKPLLIKCIEEALDIPDVFNTSVRA